MKKMCLTIVAMVFLSYCVSALTFEIKESYAPKENMLGEIVGNIIDPIEKSQIEFRRGDVRVPLNGDIGKLGEREYLWAIAPEIENNYTLYIRNITTNVAGVVKKVDLIRNFTVKGNLTSYNVEPGFIVTNKNFSINIFLYEDMKKNINVSIAGDKLLEPGENSIDFNIDNFIGESLIDIVVGNYNMPAYIIGKKNETPIVVSNLMLSISPLTIQRVVSINDRPVYSIELKNTGNTTLEDIEVVYNNKTFKVYPQEISSLKVNKSVFVNVSIIGNESISDSIYFTNDYLNVAFPIRINFTNSNISSTVNSSGKTNYYCSELNGVICSADEVCSQEVVVSLDGYCCKGKCQVQNNTSSSAWIGYLLGILVLAGLGYIVFKYKKKTPGVQSIFNRKVAEAQKKMPPNIS